MVEFFAMPQFYMQEDANTYWFLVSAILLLLAIYTPATVHYFILKKLIHKERSTLGYVLKKAEESSSDEEDHVEDTPLGLKRTLPEVSPEHEDV